MKPEYVFLPDTSAAVAAAGAADLSALGIECVTYDADGTPKRRSIVPFLSALRQARALGSGAAAAK